MRDYAASARPMPAAVRRATPASGRPPANTSPSWIPTTCSCPIISRRCALCLRAHATRWAMPASWSIAATQKRFSSRRARSAPARTWRPIFCATAASCRPSPPWCRAMRRSKCFTTPTCARPRTPTSRSASRSPAVPSAWPRRPARCGRIASIRSASRRRAAAPALPNGSTASHRASRARPGSAGAAGWSPRASPPPSRCARSPIICGPCSPAATGRVSPASCFSRSSCPTGCIAPSPTARFPRLRPAAPHVQP